MRLWSIHPKYLDTKGLVALWRESLLAQEALISKTKPYKNHPQLQRFKKQLDPISAIGSYLRYICEEAKRKGYHFNKEKILILSKKRRLIRVSRRQLLFELEHLKQKLRTRDPRKYNLLLKIKEIEPHPIFQIVEGDIEKWEKRGTALSNAEAFQKPLILTLYKLFCFVSSDLFLIKHERQTMIMQSFLTKVRVIFPRIMTILRLNMQWKFCRDYGRHLINIGHNP